MKDTCPERKKNLYHKIGCVYKCSVHSLMHLKTCGFLFLFRLERMKYNRFIEFNHIYYIPFLSFSHSLCVLFCVENFSILRVNVLSSIVIMMSIKHRTDFLLFVYEKLTVFHSIGNNIRYLHV